MKNLRLCGAVVLAIALFTACKKSSSSTSTSTKAGSLVRIVQGIDPDITNDTVYNISYNQSGKVSILVDSLNSNDTLVATYDANGNLTAVTDKGAYPINATFTYDASNHLTEIDDVLYGESQQTTFEYTNGVISKKSYYANGGSGSLQLQNYYIYTVTGGNITGINIYAANGTQQGTATVTYGTQANPFANLCLFNYGSRLGIDDLAPIESYFNKNLLTGFTVTGYPTTTSTNTFDSKQDLTKVVVNDQVNDNLLTWQFYYK
jgi:YD repeat-containing protein